MNTQQVKQPLVTFAISATAVVWLIAMAMSYEYQSAFYGATAAPVICFAVIASALWLIHSTANVLPIVAPRLLFTVFIAIMLVGNIGETTEPNMLFARVWPIVGMIMTNEMLLSNLRNKGN